MAKGQKPAPITSIPPATWAKIITDWKTGEYTQQQLSDKYRVNYGTLCNRLSDIGAKKGELIKQLEASLTEKYRQAFLARGYDEHKVAQIVGDFLEAEKRDPENPKKRVADFYNRDLGLKHLEKLTGVSDKPQDDKNTTTQVPQIKILIMSKDGEVKTNLLDGMQEINI